MKKLYSLILLPLIAVFMLVGCGETTRTVKEVQDLYNTMVEKYNEKIDENSNNWYFINKSDNEEALLKMYVTYDNSNKLNDAVRAGLTLDEMKAIIGSDYAPSEELATRYEQLTTIYARTLTMAFNYYTNWSETFFDRIDAVDSEEKEITNLYGKLNELKRELESFNTAKLNIEREVQLFGLDSEIVASSLDVFNYNYNALLEKVLNFVNYFRDLHVKYYFSNTSVINSAYAQRVYDDGLLTIANYIYYDYLKALTTNGTTNLVNVKLKSSQFDIFNHGSNNITQFAKVNDNRVKGVVSINEEIVNSLNIEGESVDKTNATNTVKLVEVALNTFKQYFGIYTKVFDKVNMESFNNYRFKTSGGYDDFDAYASTLSPVQKANVNIMIDMEENKIYDFMSSLSNLIK